ncbi:hypothetical protein RHGRI_025963 [Rhododendron griersonianum]|uniref:Uncharacterized protein n=1 Tax=Rhododendron griersonianum TaxID=479676 RepID=A0AAV6IQX7_9ERIC|nr:hypothetical protein RHGRI_025963 [Rhododendron griersonianum]
MITISVAFELFGGYLFPNKPFEKMVYSNHAYHVTTSTILFIGFLKLSHYMNLK